MEKFAAFIVRFRWPILITVLAVTGYFLWGMGKLEVKTDFMSSVDPDEPAVRLYDYLGNTFGGNDVALVALEAEDIFRRDVRDAFPPTPSDRGPLGSVSRPLTQGRLRRGALGLDLRGTFGLREVERSPVQGRLARAACLFGRQTFHARLGLRLCQQWLGFVVEFRIDILHLLRGEELLVEKHLGEVYLDA